MTFLSSALAAGALALLTSPAGGMTSAQLVYERPETRTMPSPLPRVPQAPPVMPVGGPVVERDGVPPPMGERPRPTGEAPPPPSPAPVPAPSVPEAQDVPFVGERLPVTGMDAALLLGAAALAATIGLALRRASMSIRSVSAGVFEIPFAVPAELQPASAAAPAGALAAGGSAAADRPSGRGAGPLLMLGAVAVAGGVGLALRRGGSGGRRKRGAGAAGGLGRAGRATAARGPEPTGALLVSMAVPAIARRIGGGPARRRPRRAPRARPPAPVRETA